MFDTRRETSIDPAAWPGELVESMRLYLWMLADRSLDEQTRQRISASDVVQQTYLEAHREYNQFRGVTREELRSWLRQILINNVRTSQRHVRMAKRNIHCEKSLESTAEAEAPVRTPSSIVAWDEEFTLVERALAKLSCEHRQAIELRSLRRLSFGEVGERLDRSSDAARKLWFRAVQMLQKEIAAIT